MPRAVATFSGIDYSTAILCGRHTVTADEPAARGGQDAGPSPSDLLSVALASCTAITLRMYAERKQWPLEGIEVAVDLHRAADKSTSMDRVLRLRGPLSAEQCARLADISERTPVTLTLKAGAQIRTTVEAGPK
jgi:putative redox protein